MIIHYDIFSQISTQALIEQFQVSTICLHDYLQYFETCDQESMLLSYPYYGVTLDSHSSMRSCYLGEKFQDLLNRKFQGYHTVWVTALDQFFYVFVLRDEFSLHFAPHDLKLYE